MQRWLGAALAVASCTGCLDPMVSDAPGYSRYVLPPASEATVPSAYADLQINRKIDVNDGVSAPSVPVKTGYAAGQKVSYWDFGTGKRNWNAAYVIAKCNADGSPPVPIIHAPIVDNIPGDTDYSPFRGQYWACFTPKYHGEIIPSVDALDDAVDLGLISDPTAQLPTQWINMPIVTASEGLAFSNGTVSPPLPIYYRGTVALHHSMATQEGSFGGIMDKNVPGGNVYELVKPGQTAATRVIFSQPYWVPGPDPEGPQVRNPSYSPSWVVVTITLQAPPANPTCTPPTDVSAFTQESDLVTVGMNNAVKAKDGVCVTVAVTTNRANRPFIVNDMTDGGAQ